MKKTKGFTLIELLLVIGIITLLSSVVMFNATEAKKKADDSHMLQESKQVETAITLYKEENGFVPHSTHAADGSTVSPGRVYQEGGVDDAKYVASLQPLVDAKILPKIPRSPDGKSYAYGASTNLKNAVFIANFKVTTSQKNYVEDSCSFVQSARVPTNCSLETGFISCTVYTSQNPNKICYTKESDFCSIWNKTGDFQNFCYVASACTITIPGQIIGPNSCGPYGGKQGMMSFCSCAQGAVCNCDFARVICDAPKASVCGGSNSNESCACI